MEKLENELFETVLNKIEISKYRHVECGYHCNYLEDNRKRKRDDTRCMLFGCLLKNSKKNDALIRCPECFKYFSSNEYGKTYIHIDELDKLD